MVENFADVNGIKLCYEVKGEGEPLILVHGFGSNKEGWIAQFEPLSKYFKVIRFDNRNGGKSDRPDIPNTVEMLADDVRGLLDYLQIEKAHIIGWSLGGIIVQSFAIKYPNRIKKVILINTVMGAPNTQGVEMLKNNHIATLKARKEDPEQAFWDGARLGYYYSFRKEMMANPNKKFYDLWSVDDLKIIENLNPLTKQDIINQSNALLQKITVDDLKKIINPTLLIASSHDKLTSSNSMIEMHNVISNSILTIIQKAGHSSPISRAPEINKLIIEFLKS
ncbi:MAG: alpha/beta fold hydrolase [Candidatus Hermodarchaeota archaeon]